MKQFGKSNGRYVELPKEVMDKIYNYAAQGLSDYFIHKRLLIIDEIKVGRKKVKSVIAEKDFERMNNGLPKLQDLEPWF